MLSEAEITRYSRQLLLPDLGEAGQSRLKLARVRVAGVGPLAEHAAIYLAAAGVGRILVSEPKLAARIAAVNAFSSGSVYTQSDGLDAAISTGAVYEFAATEMRASHLPAIAVQAEGDGAWVAVLPALAPCLDCARGAALAGVPIDPGMAAAAGALAALELVTLL